MANSRPNRDASNSPSLRPHEYVVVARRYRPQSFDELIGQEHVARALSNAISTNRVGHAYLFTGARGVGKTSAARIFAKALNCIEGPTPTPCNRCDICQSISTGDDIDVLEIDGASNRGIDEIRQLRQNVNVRPSRERFKVYIIDEVHMLTREAFNALLKTLEEPPEHVKFIFCTTEPGKIPITILSRCQRFDFAGIRPASIAKRLQQIVEAEGVSAEPEALELLARRAAGSMRDSQSLLEQLLAFAPERITVADVNGMLGTAGEERLGTLVSHLVQRNASAALAELDAAVQQGVEVSQLMEQLLGFLRDAMVAAVGCPGEMFLYSSPRQWQAVAEAGKRLGLETILAAMQIVDHALARMHYSAQGRVLAEMALVRICGLDDLAEIAGLIAQLQRGGVAGPESVPPALPASAAASDAALKKKPEGIGTREGAGVPQPSPSSVEARGEVPGTSGLKTPAKPSPGVTRVTLSAENATEIWSRVLASLPGFGAEHAKHFARVVVTGPNRLAVSFRPAYTFSKTVCERPEQKAKFEQALAELTGQRITVEFTLLEDAPAASEKATPRVVPPHQRMLQVAQHPMVRRAAELFGARPVRVDDPPVEKGRST
ncbi:MAG: DNA polymerase III subunit gamma/tau [Thermoguttaceae bacterium]|jgi:DNA polymerase-3 subunit gamma/tau|nr:DNA polymerase III subunit gamma/tau [Thermoguttaceae bacterium]